MKTAKGRRCQVDRQADQPGGKAGVEIQILRIIETLSKQHLKQTRTDGNGHDHLRTPPKNREKPGLRMEKDQTTEGMQTTLVTGQRGTLEGNQEGQNDLSVD